ncbi:MAG TPA: UDP-N-acetylmuramate dehydrogenase [Candidatus Paceibacterota bacterium]|nr:UDP-N-acetylmuramate dehydrogenase [Candidatus Paceibacterota bacterium]
MKIYEDADLKNLSFLQIGGTVKNLIEVENEGEIKKIVEMKESENLPIMIIGEGSNIVFNDGLHNKTFVKIKIDEILKVYEDNFGANIDVGAGTNWDKLVEWSVKNNFSGLELLSGIPGSVGACPVQNIGAYGQEISNVLTHVRTFDLETKELFEITNQDCDFQYRNSIFKKNPGRFIILNVSFRLSKKKPEMPVYKDLAIYFLTKKNKKPTLREIRKAVLEIRSAKLPNPQTDPNCGSFFKNPIVTTVVANELISKFKDIPQYKAEAGFVKLSGGWLIEKSGFKGKDMGKIRVSEKSALVLINKGNATFADLINTRDKIIDGVKKNFGVTIEVETNLIE